MKLLMIIIDSSLKEELEVLLQRNAVLGYTEIPQVHGVGETGIRMGSGAFPKTSSVFFSVLPADQVGKLKADIESYCEACLKKMKMIVWSVEEII